MYSPQDPYKPPLQPGAEPYPQPGTTSDPSQGAYPPPYPPPGSTPYPPQGAYPPPYPPPGSTSYPPQGAYQQQYSNVVPTNPQATRALIYGCISLGLSLLTLFTLIGFAGIITGIFSVIYGFTSLRVAQRLPNKVGYGKAIAAIVMGCVALLLVLVSFIIRSATNNVSN